MLRGFSESWVVIGWMEGGRNMRQKSLVSRERSSKVSVGHLVIGWPRRTLKRRFYCRPEKRRLTDLYDFPREKELYYFSTSSKPSFYSPSDCQERDRCVSSCVLCCKPKVKRSVLPFTLYFNLGRERNLQNSRALGYILAFDDRLVPVFSRGSTSSDVHVSGWSWRQSKEI